MRLFKYFITLCYEFNKFNISGTQMLDSIYHMTLKLLTDGFFGENSRFCNLLRNVIMDVITLCYKSVNH